MISDKYFNEYIENKKKIRKTLKTMACSPRIYEIFEFIRNQNTEREPHIELCDLFDEE